MNSLFNQIWYKNNPLKYLLIPISLVFLLLVKIRLVLYRIQLFKVTRSKTPVIVIGNISVGGTGKTPFIIYLANQLKQANINVAVVSRGYGRDTSIKCALVDSKGSTLQQGDEPMLIHKQSASPVVIANDRVQACQYVDSQLDVDVILADDGLQHYPMARARQWCVFEQQRKFGNKWCLPAGPLREPMSRLKEMDVVLSQNKDNVFDKDESAFSLLLTEAYQLNNPQNRQHLSKFANETCYAIAGIGNPQRFFDALQNQKIKLTGICFDDHHQYQQHDFEQLNTDNWFMTEKDAIKCKQFNLPNAWVVPVSVQTSLGLQEHINQLIDDIQNKRLLNG